MNENKAIMLGDIIKNIINVYFDTFFVIYFFKVANYEVIPLAKYYITLYLFVGIGFFLVRNAVKKNVKVPYHRIGISLSAIYISMIMLLKEEIINNIFIVGMVKGIADGFYHFPRNVFKTEKINSGNRQKYEGLLTAINQLVAIAIPLILGITLTYMSYTDLGKIFFILFIILFVLSFKITDLDYVEKRCSIKKFKEEIKDNKVVKMALCDSLLAGFTYSSGVMGTIVTLSKIYIFKTNLNIGFVDSLCSILLLIVSLYFTLRMKKDKISKPLIVCGILSFITLIVYSFMPTKSVLIIYLIVRNTLIAIINLVSNLLVANASSTKNLANEYKPEFYLMRDIFYMISRCAGQIVLLIFCLVFGKEHINYIMIIPALSILCEGILLGKLSKEIKE